jgi:hypothetical protein
MIQAGRSRVRIPKRSLDFFNLPNPSGRTMLLGLTQPVKDKNTRNIPRSEGRLVQKSDKLNAVCEPMYRKCENLDVSQQCGPPRPFTRTALP